MKDFYQLKEAIEELNYLNEDLEITLLFNKIIINVLSEKEIIHSLRLRLNIENNYIVYKQNIHAPVDEEELISYLLSWFDEKNIELLIFSEIINENRMLEMFVEPIGENAEFLLDFINDENIVLSLLKDYEKIGLEFETPLLFKDKFFIKFNLNDDKSVDVYLLKDDEYFLIKKCHSKEGFDSILEIIQNAKKEKEKLVSSIANTLKYKKEFHVTKEDNSIELKDEITGFNKNYKIYLKVSESFEFLYVMQTDGDTNENLDEESLMKRILHDYEIVLNKNKIIKELYSYIQEQTPEMKVEFERKYNVMYLRIGSECQRIEADHQYHYGEIQFGIEINRKDTDIRKYGNISDVTTIAKDQIKEFYTENRLNSLF
jgi:hypothetical protein